LHSEEADEIILSMTIRFILVEPKVPENIGAAARAVKTSGHSDLVLVNPMCSLEGKAMWVAHGSGELLSGAEKFDTLEKALAGSAFSVATTAKARKVKSDPVGSRELAGFLSSRIGENDTISIVFGREESGLTNEEIRLCDISSFIPMKQLYPSLNLAQAIMIYAYELSGLTSSVLKPEDEYDNNAPLHILKQKTGKILTNLDIPVHDARFGRIMERISLLSPSDTRLMLTVADKIDKRDSGTMRNSEDIH
jgi:tRNA/rRNA methyltransferase